MQVENLSEKIESSIDKALKVKEFIKKELSNQDQIEARTPYENCSKSEPIFAFFYSYIFLCFPCIFLFFSCCIFFFLFFFLFSSDAFALYNFDFVFDEKRVFYMQYCL